MKHFEKIAGVCLKGLITVSCNHQEKATNKRYYFKQEQIPLLKVAHQPGGGIQGQSRAS